MFNFSRNKKNNKNKEEQIAISSEIMVNQVVRQQTKQADTLFTKPNYNSQTRKAYYDDRYAHKTVKNNMFSKNDIVKDPYTGAELVPTKKEAKLKYKENWQEHLAEADHTEPLSHLVKRTQNEPWVTSDDIKKIGNSQDNYQVVAKRTNQTGGKGGSSQIEWSQNSEKMQLLSEQSGTSLESVAEKVLKKGETAEKINSKKIAKASTKNMVITSHNAGKEGALYSGSTTATISGIYNVVSCVNGEKTAEQAIKDTIKDSSKASAIAYTTSAGLTVLNHTLTSSESELLKALGEKNVPGKIITAVWVTGDTVIKWGSGEISTEECLLELGNKGCMCGGAYLGSVAGQFLIPIPVVGSAVGSFIGGTLTSNLYEAVLKEHQNKRNADIEKQRRIEQKLYEDMLKIYAEQKRRNEVKSLIQTNTQAAAINSIQAIMQSNELKSLMEEASSYVTNRIETERYIAESILITLQLREYKRQLQEYSDKYFVGYELCFSSAFELMDSSLKIGDYNGAIAGANQITRYFGKTPVIENTEDFKKKFFGKNSITF